MSACRREGRRNYRLLIQGRVCERLAPGAGTLLEAVAGERYAVHFKLIKVDTEKDNRKPSGKITRAFVLDVESAGSAISHSKPHTPRRFPPTAASSAAARFRASTLSWPRRAIRSSSGTPTELRKK